MTIEKFAENLIKKGYSVSVFEHPEEAVEYLDVQLDGKTIGFGDSDTLLQMGLAARLSTHNTVWDPKDTTNNDEFLNVAKKCLNTEIFVTSVNGASEDGTLINLDGTGNRVAGSLFGHKKVYFVLGINKIRDTIEEAISRVRTVAAPKNAFRLGLKTPCAAAGGTKCYDCSSPDRICNALTIHFRRMRNIEMEVVIIKDELGF